MEYKFTAGVVKLEAAEKKAIFYLLNTSRNRNGWGVTDQALEQGLPSIMGKPIGCGEEYKLGHFPPEKTLDVGKWVDYSKPGTYALGTAKIEDPTVWGKLEAGTWGQISVVVDSYEEHCSICGENLRRTPPDQHEHTAKGPGYIVSDSFAFVRVDFVDEPAFPQAGLQELLSMAAEPSPHVIELAASYYASQSKSTDPAPGAGAPPNGRQTGERRKAVTDKTVEELNAELTSTKTELETVKTQLATAQSELTAERAAKHMALANAAAEARFKAGLATDLKAEAERLKTRTDDVLIEMKADAETVKSRLEAKAKGTPKAEYEEGDEDTLKAAVDRARESLGLPPRTKEAT